MVTRGMLLADDDWLRGVAFTVVDDGDGADGSSRSG